MSRVTTQAVVAILQKTGDKSARITGVSVTRAGFSCSQRGDTVAVYYFGVTRSEARQAAKFEEYAKVLRNAGYDVTEVDGTRLLVEKP